MSDDEVHPEVRRGGSPNMSWPIVRQAPILSRQLLASMGVSRIRIFHSLINTPAIPRHGQTRGRESVQGGAKLAALSTNPDR